VVLSSYFLHESSFCGGKKKSSRSNMKDYNGKLKGSRLSLSVRCHILRSSSSSCRR
jgi:hypothetical protein